MLNRICVLATFSVILLSACQSPIVFTGHAATELSLPQAKGQKSGSLYVGGLRYVAVVAEAQTKPSYFITKGVGLVNALAFDQSGNLYVAGQSKRRIQVFSPGSQTPNRRITKGVGDPIAMTFDGRNTLFVTNVSKQTVAVYPDGQNKVSRYVDAPGQQLLTDSAGYLYSATIGGVNVVAPGGDGPELLLQVGGAGFPILAIDSKDNVYVANVGATSESITEFRPHSDSIIRTITTAVSSPTALTVDLDGKVYCACGNRVNVYAASGNRRLRSITRGINGPTALAIDSGSTLYVANGDSASVTEYVPSSNKVHIEVQVMPSPASLAIIGD